MTVLPLRLLRPAAVCFPHVVLGLVLLCSFALAAPPPPAPTGSIEGCVANGHTQQFLEAAEVRVADAKLSVLTDRDGTFSLRNLPAGPHTLEVSYTGLDSERRTVVVKPGASVRAEFNLMSGVAKLDAYLVAADAEGTAAQVNKQKKSDYLVSAMSSDALGEVPEGNIADLLRYMTGLQINYANADASSVSVRGQDPEATVFMIDGKVPAAAGSPPRSSTSSTDASSRAFEFTQASISTIESIEIYKAPPPWMPAATGGVINAETKNAFAQRRRVFRVTGSLAANSDMLHVGPVDGPGDRPTWRITPGGSLSYSEALLRNTLGVTLAYGESHLINPTHNNSLGYTPLVSGTTAAPLTNASPVRIDTYTLIDGPEAKHRRNLSLSADYRLGANTVLRAAVTYNYFLRQARQHTFRVRPVTSGTSASTIAAGANDRETTVLNGQVDLFADYSDTLSQNYGFSGGIRHNFRRWRFDGSMSYGKSDSRTSDLPGFMGNVQFGLSPSRGVGYRIQATRSTPAPSSLVQTAGPDLYDLNNYNQSGLSVQTHPRSQYDRTYTVQGDLRGTYVIWNRPVEIRTGASYYHLSRRKSAAQVVLTFAGRDGIVGNADDVLTAAQFADLTYGDKFLFGLRTPPLLDPYKVGAYLRQNPAAFQDVQAANVQRQAVNTQSLAEDIGALYFADTVRVTPRLSLLTGARLEATENYARGPYRIDSLGVGLPSGSRQWYQAIYSQTRRLAHRYADVFPQAQGTYRFSPDLVLRTAVSETMSRPGVQSIMPNTTVNDTGTIRTVTVNNTALKPSYATNVDVQFEYYTRPTSKFTFAWFRKRITNYIQTEQTTVPPGDDNGFDGHYAGYILNTQRNAGTGHFEGCEASLTQSLRPLLQSAPEALRNWDVFANATHTYEGDAPDRAGRLVHPSAPGFFRWHANYGLSYATPRRTFYVQVRTTVSPSAVSSYANRTTDLRNTYEARHQRWDFTARWRFSREFSVELTGTNVFKDPLRKSIQAGRVIQRWDYGATYILSFTANLDALNLPAKK